MSRSMWAALFAALALALVPLLVRGQGGESGGSGSGATIKVDGVSQPVANFKDTAGAAGVVFNTSGDDVTAVIIPFAPNADPQVNHSGFNSAVDTRADARIAAATIDDLADIAGKTSAAVSNAVVSGSSGATLNGCATFTNGVLDDTGAACGAGGGSSVELNGVFNATVDLQDAADSSINISPSGQFSLDLSARSVVELNNVGSVDVVAGNAHLPSKASSGALANNQMVVTDGAGKLITQAIPAGDVTGGASSTSGNVATYSSGTGKAINQAVRFNGSALPPVADEVMEWDAVDARAEWRLKALRLSGAGAPSGANDCKTAAQDTYWDTTNKKLYVCANSSANTWDAVVTLTSPGTTVTNEIATYSDTSGTGIGRGTPFHISSNEILVDPFNFVSTPLGAWTGWPNDENGIGFRAGAAPGNRETSAGIVRNDGYGVSWNCQSGASCNLDSTFTGSFVNLTNGDSAASHNFDPNSHQASTYWRAESTFNIDGLSGALSADERILIRSPSTGLVKTTGQIRSYAAPLLDVLWFMVNDRAVVPVDNDELETEVAWNATSGTSAFSTGTVAWVFAGSCAGDLSYDNQTARISISAVGGSVGSPVLTFLQLSGQDTALAAGKCVRQGLAANNDCTGSACAELSTVNTAADSALINGSVTSLKLSADNTWEPGLRQTVYKLNQVANVELNWKREEMYEDGIWGIRGSITDAGFRQEAGHNRCPYLNLMSGVTPADASCTPALIIGDANLDNFAGTDLRQPSTGTAYQRVEPKAAAPAAGGCDAASEVGRVLPVYGSGLAGAATGVYRCREDANGISWVFEPESDTFCAQDISVVGAFARAQGRDRRLLSAHYNCVDPASLTNNNSSDCSATAVDFYACITIASGDRLADCEKIGDLTGTLNEFNQGTFATAGTGILNTNEWLYHQVNTPSASDTHMVCVELGR